MSDDDAIIIGAGNGGMTAALTVANAGKKVLLLEKHNIPGGCRSGECSHCRTKLLSGKVYHHQDVKLRKSDRDFAYIHPLARPLEDLQLMI
jgi:succinate dehydrogenase/fumarate reductase flavoprotein subunit